MISLVSFLVCLQIFSLTTQASLLHVPAEYSSIQQALDATSPGDTVLVAGKGHEKEQVIGRDRIPFDDVAMCRKYLALRDSSPHIPILPQLVKSA